MCIVSGLQKTKGFLSLFSTPDIELLALFTYFDIYSRKAVQGSSRKPLQRFFFLAEIAA